MLRMKNKIKTENDSPLALKNNKLRIIMDLEIFFVFLDERAPD